MCADKLHLSMENRQVIPYIRNRETSSVIEWKDNVKLPDGLCEKFMVLFTIISILPETETFKIIKILI